MKWIKHTYIKKIGRNAIVSKSFKDFKEKMLKDENLKIEYDALALEYQIIASLIELRNKENLTQEELSKRIGVPKANISRFENGKHSPSIQTLARFAAGLNKRIEIRLVEIK